MPLYRYRCLACGDELDAFQTMRDEPLCKCDRCGSRSLEKVICAAVIRVPEPVSEARRGRGKGR